MSLSSAQSWRTLADTFHCLSQLIRYNKLHVWNHHDFKFDLSDILFWDTLHKKAFFNWVNGQTLGRPCRYF